MKGTLLIRGLNLVGLFAYSVLGVFFGLFALAALVPPGSPLAPPC